MADGTSVAALTAATVYMTKTIYELVRERNRDTTHTSHSKDPSCRVDDVLGKHEVLEREGHREVLAYLNTIAGSVRDLAIVAATILKQCEVSTGKVEEVQGSTIITNERLDTIIRELVTARRLQ